MVSEQEQQQRMQPVQATPVCCAQQQASGDAHDQDEEQATASAVQLCDAAGMGQACSVATIYQYAEPTQLVSGGEVATSHAFIPTGSVTHIDVYGNGNVGAYDGGSNSYGQAVAVASAPAVAIAAPAIALGSKTMHGLAQLVAVALNERCEEQRHLDRCTQSVFHSARIPSISMHDYIRRIAKYSGCSPECFVIAVVYIDRYCIATNIPITFRNIHRLYITAILISSKVRDDTFYSNEYYSKIGGVSNAELNFLETELLNTIRWNTWVEPSLYLQYVMQLSSRYGNAFVGSDIASISDFNT